MRLYDGFHADDHGSRYRRAFVAVNIYGPLVMICLVGHALLPGSGV